MDKSIHHRAARLDAIPGQQLGDGLAGRTLLAQFNDHLAARLEILKTQTAARLDPTPGQQLGDGLAGRPLLAQFNDPLAAGWEILKTQTAARLKLRGRL